MVGFPKIAGVLWVDGIERDRKKQIETEREIRIEKNRERDKHNDIN